MITLVQIPDDPGTDTSIVRLVGTGEEELVPLYTYLISEDDSGGYFLQVTSPNRNLSRFSPRPFDVISISQMLAIIEGRGYEREALVSDVRLYEAEVLAYIDENTKPQTPFTRPSTGAKATLATPGEIVSYLQLPKEDVDGTGGRRIGRLARSGSAAVPIVLTKKVFDHHILVAGATGSGKSHLLSNLAHVADNMGRCIILVDHKPDHQNHHQINEKAQFPRAFDLSDSVGSSSESTGGVVRYWTLDKDDHNRESVLLGVPANELDPEVLAGTIFYRKGEETQAETFAAIVSAFSESSDMKGSWTIEQLKEFVLSKNKHQIESLFDTEDMVLHQGVLNAIKRKLRYGGTRIPSFIDVGSPKDFLGKPLRRTGHVDNVFAPGLNVIRINEDDARGYALFLSHLLKHAAEARANSIQSVASSNSSTPEMLVIIDEAADIFTADSGYLRNAAVGMLAERIRKGRSLGIGYVIAVQDAGDVPENIRHNLNTTIVGRHRHLRTLREALPTTHEGLLSNVDKLAPGDMLIDMFGVSSLLLVKMDMSRSRLTEAS